jgi:predicted alternative tryptophan synthase beta-subunit
MLLPAATIVPPNATAIAQAPRLTVGELQYDFGDIPPTAPVSHMFIITNTGTAELVIERLTAS